MVEIHTLKPLDVDLLVRMARETRPVVTAEEHNTIGVLGRAVAEVLSEPYPVSIERVDIKDTFTDTEPFFQSLYKYGLGVMDIVGAAKMVMERRNERREGDC